MSLAGLAVAFAIRAIGDVRGNWLSLVSPLGWVQATDPFGDIMLWPLAVAVVAIAGAFAIAIFLAARRDVGAGLIEQRPGPATAGPTLGTPIGFAWRLQRTTLLWWTIGAMFMGAIYGSVISAIDDFVEENEAMRDVLEGLGMTGDALRDGFITVILSMIALIAMAGVIQSLLRPRSEEVADRAEPVLASAVSRRSWLSSHLVLTALSAPVFMVAAGLGLSITDALVVGQFTDFGDTIAASLTPRSGTVGGGRHRRAAVRLGTTLHVRRLGDLRRRRRHLPVRRAPAAPRSGAEPLAHPPRHPPAGRRSRMGLDRRALHDRGGNGDRRRAAVRTTRHQRSLISRVRRWSCGRPHRTV